MIYPGGSDVPFWYMLTVIFEHVVSTFMNTVMFVAISAFHARIADPSIGGTYMTLLATYVKTPLCFTLPLLTTLAFPIWAEHSLVSSSSN
jgi:hypothetical protein